MLTALAVAMSAIGQFRMLGGSLAVAICTNILSSSVKSKLQTVLTSNQLTDLLQSLQALKTLPESSHGIVRQVFAEAYQKQIKVLTAFSGAAVVITLMMWERHPRSVSS